METKVNGGLDVAGFRLGRRSLRRHKYSSTPAERAARKEAAFKAAIAHKGLPDSLELRVLFKLCPERFWNLPVDPLALLSRIDSVLSIAAFCEKAGSVCR
jgi:hypothetical protein